MRTSFLSTFNRSLQRVRRWYEETPERALDQAYDAALMIKALEDEHFDGGKITTESDRHSPNALACFQADLKNYLKILELRLKEFRASRYIFSSTDFSGNARSGPYAAWNRERSPEILEKLSFIDQILERYQPQRQEVLSLVPVSQLNQSQSVVRLNADGNGQTTRPATAANVDKDSDGILDKTGVLPRSITGTLHRIKRDLDPNSEEEVVQNFRNTKAKTLISIRFILLLIIVPLLTQQLSKTLIIGPIVDNFRQPDHDSIFINFELEEEALQELHVFKERIEFNRLLGGAPALADEPSHERSRENEEIRPPLNQRLESAENEEELLKEKVQEIAQNYYQEGSNAIKNVFADVMAFFAFAVVLMTNRRELEVLKTFIDETVYGLSDSAKAFIIILFTDMFVGFHSPHGWEVLLEGVARHLGIPANRNFIFLFIATFPVILDTIFKYWIFRYLNRISPSAVATYRNMNE